MAIKITEKELLDAIADGKQPVFYNAEKVAQTVEKANLIAAPKSVIREFKLFFAEDENSVPTVNFVGTTLSIPSESLCRHLFGCKRAALFCVTLGAECDREIERAKATDIEFAVLLDTAFLLLIEKACDEICAQLDKKYTGEKTTPRFSLGYGDSPLALQNEFLTLLNAQKLLGVLVTAGGMMLPSKTVTAFVGIADK
jgi:hypothetical protein